MSVFEPDGADRFRVAEGRERGEVLRVVRDGEGGIEKLYWATYAVTRTPQVTGELRRRLPNALRP